MILTDILQKNYKEHPNCLALTMRMGYRTVNLTYKDVYNLARQTALFLEENGIKKGDKVLIFAPNSPYWGVVLWAILLQGAVVVPINVQSTGKMIERIALQTDAKLVFKSRFLRREFPDNLKNYDIEFLDELVSEFNPDDFKIVDASENDLVEILYTSGTTGEPKGVMLTNKNICSNVVTVSKIVPFIHCKERLLSILPLTHIFEQVLGFFLPAFYVEHVIYVHSYPAILDLLKQYKITVLLTVPEFLKILMSKIKGAIKEKGKLGTFNKMLKIAMKINSKLFSHILFYSLRKKFGGCLNLIASGGAFLDPELESEWRALGINILQGYGLTETSPLLTGNTVQEYKLGSVGKVIEGVKLKISEEGEVLAKGPNVFQGYFKNEEKTKDAFTSDGWFKTDDGGYFDAEGFLFLKGRRKYVFQGPGAQLIYPEDIELELGQIEGVKDSCVLGITKSSGMLEIHAVLLLKDTNTDVEKIIDQANNELASYQHITGWSIWQEQDFPRSATKKVKKEEVLKKLSHIKNGGVIKKEEQEKSKLMQILNQISGFELGHMKGDTKIIQDLKLDSLMIVEFIVRIEEGFGVTVDQTLIKLTTTINQLEEIIQKKEPAKKPLPLKKWPRSWWASLLRMVLQFFAFLYLRIFIKLKVEGKGNLKKLPSNTIFMMNHLSYIDPLALGMALPFSIRRRLVFAAAKDVLYGQYKKYVWIADLFFNSFALPRLEGENIKIGLDHMGKLLDDGYSIGFFPEGKVSLDGKFQPLRPGAGFIAVEMNAFVVPMFVSGTNIVTPYGSMFPKHRGKVTIKIGKPIKFKKSDSYEDVNQTIEDAMRTLK